MNRTSFFLCLLSIFLLVQLGCGEAEKGSSDPETDAMKSSTQDSIDYLWTLIGESGTYSDSGGLVLNGLEEQVVYTAERPGRQAGTLPIADFLKMWQDPETVSSLETDPPNALLTTIDETGKPSVAAMELTRSKFSNRTAQFVIAVHTGKIPPVFGSATLVIDGLVDTITTY